MDRIYNAIRAAFLMAIFIMIVASIGILSSNVETGTRKLETLSQVDAPQSPVVPESGNKNQAPSFHGPASEMARWSLGN